MGKLFWLLLLGFGVFAAYHYYPKETKHAGTKIVDTTVAATKAGYKAASN